MSSRPSRRRGENPPRDDTAAKLRMSKQLTRIDEARELIRSILHGRLNEAARDHLNRALDHVAEAWLAQSGQESRSVQAVAIQTDRLKRLCRSQGTRSLKE